MKEKNGSRNGGDPVEPLGEFCRNSLLWIYAFVYFNCIGEEDDILAMYLNIGV